MPKHLGMNSIKQALAALKPQLTERFGLKQIGVFGSVVRGEATETSDIDILIDYSADSTLSLFDIITLEEELSSILQADVDIVTLPSLKRHIGERILSEVEFV
jgi:predicted nucleotidyltransferase